MRFADTTLKLSTRSARRGWGAHSVVRNGVFTVF
jgi:hypothetical protein